MNQSVNQSVNQSLINRTRIKRECLRVANEAHEQHNDTVSVTRDVDGKQWNWTRARAARTRGKYTRVSDELLDELDAQVRELVRARVRDKTQSGSVVR